MARILIGVAGEGRGHATRTRGLTDLLEKLGHEVDILAGGVAYSLLYEKYGERVREIPVPRFSYRKDRLSYLLTLINNFNYIVNLPKLIAKYSVLIDNNDYDLIISDFEPLTARIANKLQKPLLVLDHQHFIVAADFRKLPLRLRAQIWPLRHFIKFYCPTQSNIVISSFFRFKKRQKYKYVKRIGLIPRDIISEAKPVETNNVLVYFRDSTPSSVLDELKCNGYRFIIYGISKRVNKEGLEFKEISEAGFAEDLISCKAVITNAGNQLIGEALFLGKPVLALPESNNVEQMVNAYYLKQSGCGTFMNASALTRDHVRLFLQRDVEYYKKAIPPPKIDGREAISTIIEDILDDDSL